MPIYEFSCSDCEHVFEVMQKMTDSEPDACPACGGPNVGKMMSSAAFHLKGGGWYSDGYSKEKKTAGSDSPKAPSCGGCASA